MRGRRGPTSKRVMMEQFVVDRLRESLHDCVVTPNDPDYDPARATFSLNIAPG
jgi:hypothetical protein